MAVSVPASFSAAVGILGYNGYLFDSAAQVTADSTNVRDEADRTTIYIRTEITAKGVVAPGMDMAGNPVQADAWMDGIRRLLTQDGQRLTFTNKGFGGPMDINVSSMRDVKWGPKTQMIHWEPIGANLAVEFVWKCVVHLPLCCCGNEVWTGIMALNYEAAYDIDQHGLTTRTVTGYLEIAQTRYFGAKQVPDSADLYWKQIRVNPPTGYKRTTRRSVSKDKSRLDFTIVDTQLPSKNAYPAYCTDIKARHSRTWSRGGALQYRNTISVEVTPQVDRPPGYGWLVFGNIVAQRILLEQYKGNTVLIDELSAEEDIFGLASSFRCSYRTISTIFDFLGGSGLWAPLGTDWGQWQYSLQPSMFSATGLSHLTNQPSDDAIVDLCGPGSSGPGGTGDGTPIQPASRLPTFKNQTPPPKQSYVHYHAEISVDGKTPLVRQKTLQPGDAAPAQWDPTSGQPFTLDAAPSGAVPDVIIQRGIKKTTVHFRGSAIRAGYTVPRPSIQSIGGVPVTQKRIRWQSRIIGNYLGVAVYAAAWDVTYELAAIPPGPVNAPADPPAGVDDNGQAVQPSS